MYTCIKTYFYHPLYFMYLKSYMLFYYCLSTLTWKYLLEWKPAKNHLEQQEKSILTDCFLSVGIKFINLLLIFTWNFIIPYSSNICFGMGTTKTVTHALQLPCFEIYLVLENQTTLSLISFFPIFIFCQRGFQWFQKHYHKI